MVLLELKFKNNKFEDAVLIEFKKLMEFQYIEKEEYENVIAYQLNEDEFVLIGEKIDDILKVLLEKFSNIDEAVEMIEKINKYLDLNINSKEFVLKNMKN